MPSKPINTGGFLFGPVEYSHVFYPDANETYQDSGFKRYLRGFRSSKPAGVSVSPTSSGWRDPTAWYRLRDVSSLQSAGQTVVRRYDRTADYLYRNRWILYPPGTFWAVTQVNSAPDFPMELEDRNVIKALLKLKGVNGGVNLSVMFAERKEAAELMTSSVERIAGQIRKFKSSRPKDWAKVIRNQLGYNQTIRGGQIPNSWLELQYGWLPSISDVHDSISALESRERDDDAYRATIKSVLIERSSEITDVAGHHYGNSSLKAGLRGPLNAEFVSFLHLDYVLENPLTATLASLGVLNPAVLAWEKLPYSFVVDWFAPVGDYLSAWDAAVGWRFKAGTMSRFTRYSIEAKPYVDSFGNTGITGISSDDTYKREGINLNRKVLTSSPLPRFPGIKNPLSTGHIANAMALLVSAFR